MIETPIPSAKPSQHSTPTWRFRFIGWGVLIALGVAVTAITGSGQQASYLIGSAVGATAAIYFIYRYLGIPMIKKSHFSENGRAIVALLISAAIYTAVSRSGNIGILFGLVLFVFIIGSALDEWRKGRRDRAPKT